MRRLAGLHPPAFLFLLFILFGGLSGCTTALKLNTQGPADAIFKMACHPIQLQSITGTAWIKIISKDLTGQYPATVLAHAPDRLALWINNPLGGVDTTLSFTDGHYEMTRAGSIVAQDNTKTWNGIPLKWAVQLFLGQIPCPLPGARTHLKIEDDQLIVSVGQTSQPDEIFVYTFQQSQDQPITVASLHWEKLRTEAFIDFKFSNLKWEAKSPQGLIKVVWKNQEELNSWITDADWQASALNSCPSQAHSESALLYPGS